MLRGRCAAWQVERGYLGSGEEILTLLALEIPMAGVADKFDKAYEDKAIGELASAPVSALQGVSDGDAEHLKAAFNIKTVKDLGTNKFFLWAHDDAVELGRHAQLTGAVPVLDRQPGHRVQAGRAGQRRTRRPDLGPLCPVRLRRRLPRRHCRQPLQRPFPRTPPREFIADPRICGLCLAGWVPAPGSDPATGCGLPKRMPGAE